MRTQTKQVAGFSLVEILVAMVISLLGTIIIFQVFSVSEGIKRTTTSGGDAQQNGLLALVSIEREARMAGFGINFAPLLGCTVQAHDEGPPVRDFTFRLLAAQITDGVANAPDTITFTYGNSGQLLAPLKLTSTSTTTGALFKVDNRFGFSAGDVIVAGEIGASKDCTMRQVTDLPATPTEDVPNISGTYVNSAGNTVTARYNKSGGVGIAYSTWDNTSQSGGRLFNIGSAPAVLTFSVSNSQLLLQSFVSGGGAAAVADGIVQLQAMYGRDTDGDGNVDSWTSTMPVAASATDWSRVIALRIGIVARSNLAEKPNATTGLCDATVAEPTWTGGTLVISTDPNWKCYRYRVFETTVPLRNMIWLQIT
jgi:type IV pilus assembly protein PilW